MTSDEEALRAMYGAWNTGGPRAAGESWAEDIVIHDFPELPDGGVSRGREEAVRTQEERMTSLDLELEVTAIEEVGPERFLTTIEIFAEGADTGISLSETHHHLVAMRNAKVAEARLFRDAIEAREAAGLD